jgi:hypothetical protein
MPTIHPAETCQVCLELKEKTQGEHTCGERSKRTIEVVTTEHIPEAR